MEKIKNSLKILNVVGARPNFMKIAPIIDEINKLREKNIPINSLLVHTGQHYDKNMSDNFFKDLNIPNPDIYLGVGSGTHAEQTGKIMIAFEKVLLKENPDLVIVVGDVNSTMACTITAKKLNFKVAHVEAGLRSYDMTMPEEINRMVTDILCDLLFTTDIQANENLKLEGIKPEKIFFVGNVMIDTLLKYREKASQITRFNDIKKNKYAVLTLHRPSNVDNKETIFKIFRALNKISERIPIIFPIHPRTKKQIEFFKVPCENIFIIEPLSYLEMLNLTMDSSLILTDSGGLQEESTFLGIPCITIRENTERPITVKIGTNIVVGTSEEKILEESIKVIEGKKKKGGIPKFWDGKTASRIMEIILGNFNLL